MPPFFYCSKITPSIVLISSPNYALVNASAKLEEMGPIDPSEFLSEEFLFFIA